MKMIGLMIAIILVSLLFVWWLDLSISSTNKAITTTQQVEDARDAQDKTGIGPLDYSKQKAEEINELNQNRVEDVNQLP